MDSLYLKIILEASVINTDATVPTWLSWQW